MDFPTVLIQTLNGLQYGLLLFLIASGLTLIFGIMHIINLAHGALYMVGAYLAFWLTALTGNLFLAILLGLPLAALLGVLIERFLIQALYRRDHLDQVLMTFGLILVIDSLRSIAWGNDVHSVAIPALLEGSVQLTETLEYPVYRLFISAVCGLIALAMYLILQHSRLGIIIRGGASNREMVQGLGINIRVIYSLVFAAGTALTALAGMVAAPVSSVYPGMGNQILIIAFVVVVIGGLGSIRGAFLAALLVGLTATWGAVLVPEYAGMAIYVLMAVVLLFKPRGLFA
ncbi:branched-chain amino acid ABC transporter permease [Pseudomonas lalucatii]|uniref:Branched-chain amino acid ABC transporter permease n=1 Tax=Pseudomonas lalucatii TaxID=1424203 RepID=A0ABS5Q2F6_9PSED|nr:branched-chain amino acid ABC transporter permease [Pseudomonas lalucatii]MBS7662948.1 branched-chain amino acid ABC transporter permease [Pseudomonas lalucatii]MBS7724741.1 branched-chain amino acid ABC transporter permease [Pseudomonas lalucatii]QVM87278.1 branched-chain amino acid ABC transporter permease [Pseudomonas lalucatii]